MLMKYLQKFCIEIYTKYMYLSQEQHSLRFFFPFFQNPTQVATSLQVFHNLGCLHTIVDRVVQGCQENLHKNIRSCLDVRALSQQSSSKGKNNI